MPKQTVAIIGMGMMGGSLGLAIRKRRLPYRVVGIGRKLHKLDKARRLGACGTVTVDMAEGVKDADIVVLCTPVSEIVNTFQKILPHLRPGAAVTDIGSVKGLIARGARDVLSASGLRGAGTPEFVGGHPLAGSEKTGVEAGNPDLYVNAAVVLCPEKRSSNAVKKLVKLWRSVGARTLLMSPDVHDVLVAQTSHLPHVLAAALAQQVFRLQRKDPVTALLLAGSFRDMTRIADSDSVQWAEICSANQKFVVGALKSYIDVLGRVLQTVQSSNNGFSEWKKYFLSARHGRGELLAFRKKPVPAVRS